MRDTNNTYTVLFHSHILFKNDLIASIWDVIFLSSGTFINGYHWNSVFILIMIYREELLLRKQRVASLSRDEEEAGGGKGGGGGCVTHSLTLTEEAERTGKKDQKKKELGRS